MTKNINKKIEYLDEHEYVLRRPNIFIGDTEQSDEKIPIIENETVVEKTFQISVGLYKILNEVIDNAFDEAKRQSKHCKIILNVQTSDNKIVVSDTGGGFLHPDKKNTKTKLTNVETAVSKLRSGSNFDNSEVEDSIIGTNGMGVCLTNMFSEVFSIETTNKTITYSQTWNNFVTKGFAKKQSSGAKTGTTVSFIPRKDVFKNETWNIEYLRTQCIFRNFVLQHDKALSHIEFEMYVDNVKVNLKENFVNKQDFLFTSKNSIVYIIPYAEGNTRISFVNGTQTTSYGQRQIHELLFQEKINDLYKNENANNHYVTYIFLNLPPKYVKFADQNKTRLITNRALLQEFLDKDTKACIKSFKDSEAFKKIQTIIEEFENKKEIKKLQKTKTKKDLLFNKKYFPSNKKRIRLFLAEGKSAGNPLAQYRNKDTDAVYALQGKIVNAQSVKELNDNEEIKDLISILNLDNTKEHSNYQEIVIATDADVDGFHITALIINFFWKWYRYIIQQNRLKILKKPLISLKVRNKKEYFYSMSEFKQKYPNQHSNISYLKGLGSYDKEDWKYIFDNFETVDVVSDKDTDKLLHMAFSDDAQGRKEWLNQA